MKLAADKDQALDKRWMQLATGLRDKADEVESEAATLVRGDMRRVVGFRAANEFRHIAADIVSAIEEDGND